MVVWPEKDPDETVEYGFKWAQELAPGRSISASDWFVEEGGVILTGAAIVTGTETHIRVAGGVIGTPAVIRNRVTLDNGEIYEERARIPIRSS